MQELRGKSKMSRTSHYTVDTRNSSKKENLSNRLLEIIQGFAEEAVEALDNHSPFKIRGKQLIDESEQFE